MSLANITIAEALALIGVPAAILASFKGWYDAKKAAAPTTPTPVSISGDPRLVDAVENIASSLRGLLHSTKDWRDQYERDKSNDRLHALETRLAELVGSKGESLKP